MINIEIQDLINSIDDQYEYFKEKNLNNLPIGDIWYQRIQDNINKIRSHPDLIYNYNELALGGIGDSLHVGNNFLLNISPVIRSRKYTYKHIFKQLVNSHHSAVELLKKYPADTIGNRGRYRIKYNNYKFTLSLHYLYHIERLAIFNETIGDKIKKDFIACDIGSNEGLHSTLLKKEYPSASFVLIDLPEQLIYTNYYLKNMFKDAKIATFTDIKKIM